MVWSEILKYGKICNTAEFKAYEQQQEYIKSFGTEEDLNRLLED